MTSFVGVCLVVMFIADIRIPINGATTTAEEDDESGSVVQVLRKRPKVLVFFLIFIIYNLVYKQYGFSLPITLDIKFLTRGPEIFGLLMSVNALTVVALSTLIIICTRKYKPINNMVMGGILFAIGFGMIGLISTFFMFIISTIIWTVGEILISTNYRVYIANNSPRNYRARFAALGNISIGIGGALGTSVIGECISAKGINAVWSFIFILAVTASLFMLFLSCYYDRFFQGSSISNHELKQ